METRAGRRAGLFRRDSAFPTPALAGLRTPRDGVEAPEGGGQFAPEVEPAAGRMRRTEEQLTDDQFFELCWINRELRIERTAQGGLSIMSPAGGDSSAQNAQITTQLVVWAKRDGTGRAFDSSGGFKLPNGAVRAPDAAWVGRARLASLTAGQRTKFLKGLQPGDVVGQIIDYLRTGHRRTGN